MVRFLQRHKIASLVLGGLFTAALIAPVQVYAEPSSDCSPITSGLWTGVGFVSSMQFDCQGNPIAGENMAMSGMGMSNTSMAPNVMTGEYVALGDSVAAGLGLPLTANGPNNPTCGVSDQAYPAEVAASLGMPYQNDACSGATAGDLVTDQGLSGTEAEIQPQLDAAFADGTPSLITITAGANDVYWSTFLRQCYTTSCGGGGDKAVASGLRTVLGVKLSYALNDISSRSGGNPPPVIITGYYQPLSTACAGAQTKITAGEIDFIRSQTDTLNQTIASVASGYSFVRYAPVDFSSHELCTSDPWVQGPNDPAPFHPTAQGQRAIAGAVLANVK